MTTTSRRFASVIAFGLVAAASACGGDVVLPNESRPAAIVIVDGNDQQAAAGAVLEKPLTVKVTDALARPVEGQMVAFTIDAGGGQVAPASIQTGPDGEASATWTLGASAGAQRVQAKVDGTDAPADLLVKFNASATSGTRAVLEIESGDQQEGVVNSALSDSLVVKATDLLGNPVAGVDVQWTVASGGGSITPASVTTDGNGLAAAERVLGSGAGPQSAQASAASLEPVTFNHTAIAANPTALVIVSGNDQTGAVGATLAAPLVVRLEDDDGNGVAGKAITWLVAPGSGSVNPTTVNTNANGLATTEWTLGPLAAKNHVSAVFSGLPPVQFEATGGAGEPSKLVFTRAPVNTSAGATIVPSVQVSITDANDNTVTAAQNAITLAIGNNPAGGVLSGTATANAVNGVATFAGLSIDKAGSGYTLTATSGSLTGATSPAFDVLTGGANRLVFIAGPTDRLVGEPFTPAIQVQVQDAGGNPVLLATDEITITSSVTGTLSGTAKRRAVLGTATFSNLAITKQGIDYTLTALASGLASATTGTFVVNKGATTIAITSRNPSSSSLPGQNVAVGYNVDVTSPAAGSLSGSVTVSDGTTSCIGGINAGTGMGSCTLAFPNAGDHQLTATYSGDDNFEGSTSSPVGHTVRIANTALNVTQDAPDPSLLGNAVSVRWRLLSPGSAPPTGDVTVTVSGGSETCSAPAVLGGASCDLTFVGNGSRTITVAYPGDGNYNPSSVDETHAVLGATSTTVTSALNPSPAGQTVTFTAHVAAVSGSGTPTGQVRFFDGSTQIAVGNLNASGDASSGAVGGLSVGDHTITAAYQGNTTTFDASTSAPLTQHVDPVPNVAPSAVADGYTVQEDGTLDVSPGNGVLKNDDDPDNGPSALVARNASDPAGGSVILDSDGSFIYTPDPDFNGTDTFTYEAFDGAAATSATVTVNVTPVNDQPSFTSLGSVTVLTTDPPYSAPWATGSPGPANESGQSLTYTTSVDLLGALLFSQQPSVAPDGTLSFTTNGTAGSAVVTVHVADNGGGADTSPNQQFTITINNP